MHFKKLATLLIGLCLSSANLFSQEKLTLQKWDVDNVERTAWVHIPQLEEGDLVPLVFAWHGYGGSGQGISRGLKIHSLWPEAIVVYPQGLDLPSYFNPRIKKPGWETRVGAEKNRDLKFFDIMLESFKKKNIVDENKIHSTGHSNGSAFTYVLLYERGNIFGSIASSSGFLSKPYRGRFPPKIPILHLAGERDTVVLFDWQAPLIELLIKNNDWEGEEPWGDHPLCKIYLSKLNAPIVTYIHPGGHIMPRDTGKVFVNFLKAYAKKTPNPLEIKGKED